MFYKYSIVINNSLHEEYHCHFLSTAMEKYQEVTALAQEINSRNFVYIVDNRTKKILFSSKKILTKHR